MTLIKKVCTCRWSAVNTTTIDPPEICKIDPNCPEHADMTIGARSIIPGDATAEDLAWARAALTSPEPDDPDEADA
jgi:hypothetical protein